MRVLWSYELPYRGADSLLPRVDRPFSPVEHEGDLLFPYTNWTSGGLIRFDPQRKKVKWQFTKRGRAAPPRGRRLIVAGQTAIITMNGGSSIMGVDLATGKARWTIRAQWLYTPIEVCDSSIIFGTSGGYGRHLLLRWPTDDTPPSLVCVAADG